jgi:hypothetical protein
MSDPSIRNDDMPAAAVPSGRASMKAEASGILPIVAISVLVAVVVGIAAFTAYWYFAIATLEERVAGWIEQREAEGWRIDHGAMTRSGFPTRLRLMLADGSIAAPAGWAWTSPGTKVSLPVFAGWGGRAAPVEVAFEGEQRLRMLPAGTAIVARGDRLVARVTDAGRLPTGTFAADNLVVSAEGGAPVAIGRIDATSAGDPGRPSDVDQASFDLAVNAQTVTLPPSFTLALGDRIERFDVEARLMGSLGKPPWPEALNRWREDGGTIEVTRLGIAYGPLDLSGDGTLALDAAGDVIAAFSITAEGLVPTLSALAERGVITPEIAAAARLVLRPPAGHPADADRATGRGAAQGAAKTGTAKPEGGSLTVPVSIQNRIVFLGPLPIARLPAPPWSLRGGG